VIFLSAMTLSRPLERGVLVVLGDVLLLVDFLLERVEHRPHVEGLGPPASL